MTVVDDTTIRAKIENLPEQIEDFEPVEATPPTLRFAPFPTWDLPQPISTFIATAAESIGCDETYVALPLLAGLASAIGNTRRIQLKRGWEEPSVLWMGIVGNSGTSKSPALDVALKPILARQGKAMQRYSEAIDSYKDELIRYESDLAQWKKSKHKATDPPREPEAPICERFWCDDTTVEALATRLQDQERGLLLKRDELSGWYASFDRYTQASGGDVARWLEVFGAREMIIDRKTGAKVIRVKRAAVSIAGGIQPAILTQSLSSKNRENGLAARMLFAYPPRRPKQWVDIEISRDDLESINRVFDALYSLNHDTGDDGELVPIDVPLTSSGRRTWITYYNQHARVQADLDGDLAAAFSKLEAYTARFALVVHFVRWASGDITLEDNNAIDQQSIECGITLSNWFGNEARRIYPLLGETDGHRGIRRTIEIIESRGGLISLRDYQRAKNCKTSEEASRDIDAVISEGLGEWEHPTPGPNGGRPTKRFRLHDNTTKRQNPIAGTSAGVLS